MKRFYLLVIFACCAFFEANAQFYDSYNYYLYIEVGRTPSEGGTIYYVHFDSDGDMYCGTISKSTLISKYKADILDEYAINKSHSSHYDSDTSTYKYEVYVKKTYSSQNLWGTNLPAYDPYTGAPLTKHSGYGYHAFSNDRKEMITWNTGLNSDEPRNKKYYKLVEVDEFIPAPANYDFLN